MCQLEGIVGHGLHSGALSRARRTSWRAISLAMLACVVCRLRCNAQDKRPVLCAWQAWDRLTPFAV
eukprot:8680420-Alexandrium_andersonii.AAC.1